MKKYITAAAFLAAGTAFANAVVLSTNIPEGTSASSGNYSGIAFSVSSDWLSGSLSSEKYSSFSLDSITLECAGSSSWTSTYKLTIYSGTTYYAVSSVLSTNESDATKATFAFETPVSLNLDTVYYARFCSSGTHMEGNTVTGGSFGNMNQRMATYSNSNLGTSDTTTGLLAAAGNNNNAVSLSETGYKANISLSGTPTSIPEPSAFGLLAGVGVLALVAARRRRSRKAA